MINQQRKRLFFRCHYRGMKELELILSSFAKQSLPAMDRQELQDLEALLDYPDNDILAAIYKCQPLTTTNPKIEIIMNQLRALPVIHKAFNDRS